LLNDNDIRGAKWILININSSEGEHEFTMDEVEIIQGYLLSQAGEGTDVILGMGYDNTLDNRLGITLIATGFEHKDPFAKPVPKKEEPKQEAKIVMTLRNIEEAEKQARAIAVEPVKEEVKPVMPEKAVEVVDLLAPKLVEEMHIPDTPMPTAYDMIDTPEIKDAEPVMMQLRMGPEEDLLSKNTNEAVSNITVNKLFTIEKTDSINSGSIPIETGTQTLSPSIKEKDAELILSIKDSTSTTNPLPAAAGGYLARPSNIYAESKPEVVASTSSAEQPVPPHNIASNEEDELLELQMQIVERDDIPAADVPRAYQAQPPLTTEVEDPAMRDETEEQKRRAAERLQKLRNLSFNVNANDPNNEFETVPAYIRRNMELYNSTSQVENFYSNYEVKTDQNNQTQISTINTFLDGKKPD
jgi:cell division protein FtsZ